MGGTFGAEAFGSLLLGEEALHEADRAPETEHEFDPGTWWLSSKSGCQGRWEERWVSEGWGPPHTWALSVDHDKTTGRESIHTGSLG